MPSFRAIFFQTLPFLRDIIIIIIKFIPYVILPVLFFISETIKRVNKIHLLYL